MCGCSDQDVHNMPSGNSQSPPSIAVVVSQPQAHSQSMNIGIEVQDKKDIIASTEEANTEKAMDENIRQRKVDENTQQNMDENTQQKYMDENTQTIDKNTQQQSMDENTQQTLDENTQQTINTNAQQDMDENTHETMYGNTQQKTKDENTPKMIDKKPEKIAKKPDKQKNINIQFLEVKTLERENPLCTASSYNDTNETTQSGTEGALPELPNDQPESSDSYQIGPVDAADTVRYTQLVTTIKKFERSVNKGLIELKELQIKNLQQAVGPLEHIYNQMSATPYPSSTVCQADMVEECFLSYGDDPELTAEEEGYIDMLNEKEILHMKVTDLKAKEIQAKSDLHRMKIKYAQLQEYYEEEDQLLGHVFHGGYCSDDEERMEEEVQFYLQEKMILQMTYQKWQNAKRLVVMAEEQLDHSVHTWVLMSILPSTPRYKLATETRDLLYQACQNLDEAHKLLTNVQFPYCTPAEVVTLSRAITHIYTDMLTQDRIDHAQNCYSTLHTRCVALEHWLTETLTDITDDFAKSVKSLHTAELTLHREHLRVMMMNLDPTLDDSKVDLSLTIDERSFKSDYSEIYKVIDLGLSDDGQSKKQRKDQWKQRLNSLLLQHNKLVRSSRQFALEESFESVFSQMSQSTSPNVIVTYPHQPEAQSPPSSMTTPPKPQIVQPTPAIIQEEPQMEEEPEDNKQEFDRKSELEVPMVHKPAINGKLKRKFTNRKDGPGITVEARYSSKRNGSKKADLNTGKKLQKQLLVEDYKVFQTDQNQNVQQVPNKMEEKVVDRQKKSSLVTMTLNDRNN